MLKSITKIAIDQLVPHPHNPRRKVDVDADFLQSIKENGVRYNLAVIPADPPEYRKMVKSKRKYTGKYLILAGHRRHAAALECGLADLPCSIYDQYDHRGMVFARNKMGKQKPPSLLIEPQESGLFIAANLGLTEDARRLYENINSGLVCKMSWAFRIIKDAYDQNTRTRTILKIGKVFDVSAVSHPANSDTEITARSYFDGVIEAEQRETLVRNLELLKLNLKLGGIRQ